MSNCVAGTWKVHESLSFAYAFQFEKGTKVLVTGGAGFVGSSLVKRLVAIGAEVHVIDNLFRGSKANLYRTDGSLCIAPEHFHLVDLTDSVSCLRLIRGFDIVYHLADVVGGCEFVFDNEAFVFRQNTMINTNVLAATIANGIRNYVYVGTACSWPLHLQMDKTKVTALKESQTFPAMPESSYGWSKLMGEYEAELALKTGKCNVGILRFHNVYGPGSSFDSKNSQFLPAIMQRCMQTAEGGSLSVWGSGNQYRDFVYIDDIVRALILIAERGMNKGSIQVGSGIATRIKDAARVVAQLAGSELCRDVRVVFDETRPEGDFGRIAVLDRARDILGWTPRVLFEEGARRTFLSIIESTMNSKL